MKKMETYNNWESVVQKRRFFFFMLVIVPAVITSINMAHMLPEKGRSILEIAVVILFGLLFTWISIGFWISIVGLVQIRRHFDRFSFRMGGEKTVSLEHVRTAVIMPVYNEDPRKVAHGLEVMYHSLVRTGSLSAFDFYILSDTNDPDIWVGEEAAWINLCTKLDAFSHVYYRHRHPNIQRKSGNIADFCRKWGYMYEFMIVLDADSIMTGDAMVRMVTAMINNPKIGILQTVPITVNRETLFARTLQFANHVYGPLWTAGLYYIEFGDAQYWGHNAIIRVDPFMRHCGLPTLPGRPPLGGEIMSHDFVESALMRRMGWEVWMTYDFSGSYEEAPPTLLDELQRDRRWCQGNLQHLKLLFVKGLIPTHRALFLKGVFSYGSALLWSAYLFISTLLALWQKIGKPKYFPETHSLFPIWPVWQWKWGLTLIISAFVILFMPKVLSLIRVWSMPKKTTNYGGHLNLFLSMIIESVISVFLAPIRMVFHSKFVLLTLLGKTIGWDAQSRDDRGTSWREALSAHSFASFCAIAAGFFVGWIDLPFLLWLSPVLIPIILSPAISVITSKATIGRWFMRKSLLIIPEEINPPQEISELYALASRNDSAGPGDMFESMPGFIHAVTDPQVNNMHIAFLNNERSMIRDTASEVEKKLLNDKAINHGPDSLSTAEKLIILRDPDCLSEMHQKVWELPDSTVAHSWGLHSTQIYSWF